ncbi:hypothetical protein [Planococcus halotolerans]|uniref:Uncharacterized protein n=1 Tax=Planococcus halotolerans TaxID=2233542 RepID=A0A365L0U4_9BACL|nr:hypothetical protein [Planococcus halotolerans]QHJ71183.1 hypothetical protein DNR44_011380 [Planococcus halotolerans]RAZ79054.1 hypothetical protein DP120_05410 [Planococcus halotolerans]
MRNLSKITLFVSLFLLIGFPMIFMIISMFTDQWIYMFSGSVPSVLAGAFGIFFLIQQYRKTDEEEA